MIFAFVLLLLILDGSDLQCKVAFHVIGAGLCNTVLIKRSFLLVLPFFFAPDPAHVYFSFLFYFFSFIQLLFLLTAPTSSIPIIGQGEGKREEALGPFFFFKF